MPVHIAFSVSPQRNPNPDIIEIDSTSFFFLLILLLSHCHTETSESPVCKMNVAIFSSSPLLPQSLVCSWIAVGHSFCIAVCKCRHLRVYRLFPTRGVVVWYEYHPLLTGISLATVQQQHVPSHFTLTVKDLKVYLKKNRQLVRRTKAEIVHHNHFN